MEIDLAQFIAAVIYEAGGEIQVSYEGLMRQTSASSITIDLNSESAIFTLKLINTEDIPDDID